MSIHTSTKKKSAAAPAAALSTDPESIRRCAELLKLRTLAPSTQAEYVRYLRKLAGRVRRDPAELTEAEVRAHLLYLKEQHGYSPSSMRTEVAALVAFYNLHLGHDWKLFGLVRSPSAQTLPQELPMTSGSILD